MKSYRVVYVDAFTATPLTGNPCGVLPDARGLTDDEMQAIAAETNLSETAFVLPSERADFRARYFTPRRELPFAGHPTIATAFALAEEGLVKLAGPVTPLRLELGIGVIPVEIHSRDRKTPDRVVMTQQKPVFGQIFTATETASCLSLDISDLLTDPAPQVVSTGVPFLIVPARDVAALQKVQMQRDALVALCARAGVNAAFMFCLGGYTGEADTAARLLDPQGTSEDPYTGSATGCLGAYVVQYGLRPGPRLVAEQGHPLGRPGCGELEIVGSPGDIQAVRLGGAAVRSLEGRLLVP
jgi:trans-2,3-dihydro-3-hydroxyanthranilate isomerase